MNPAWQITLLITTGMLAASAIGYVAIMLALGIWPA